EYFLHDRAVRESGHDTTYRYEGRCANLATIDLNSLLYKYETDIADMITSELDGDLVDYDGVVQDAGLWRERARQRKARIDKYLWNEQEGLYFDYDTVAEENIHYESVTTFWAMWAGCASQAQAERMTRQSLHKFEVMGGLVSGTIKSRGEISLDRPNHIQQRLAYRWLYIITKSFVDFNGVVPEKYDVVGLTHKVQVEYGNVGVDFKYVSREGFGWMNASYQIGLSIVTKQMRRALGTCTSPDVFFEKTAAYLQQAKEITQNGQTISAITVIEPVATSAGLSKDKDEELVTPPDIVVDRACRNESVVHDYFSTEV
ncbi:alpha,alpha-trehalase nth1, partial [Rhizopus stolonifer]